MLGELELGGQFMAELVKDLANVVCRGGAAHALVVIPVEVNARKHFPIPVLCDGVKFL